MIQVRNLTKRYGRTVAVDNLSFTVNRGEIVGFLGPNGAGKTTTMRVLSCYLPATGGTVSISGLDVFRDSLEVRRKIGYLPENVPLYHDMRVNEYLAYRGALKGLRGRRLRERIKEVGDSCGIADIRRAIIGSLSKGYRQRVGLADALIHEPELLILDEPTIGLDPNQTRQIRALIRGLAPRHTVLLSSHILSEVEMICDRVLILCQGRVVASDTPASLVGLMKGDMRVIAEIRGPADEIRKRLEALSGVVQVTCEATPEWVRVICECDRKTDIRPDLFSAVAAQGWVLRELKAETLNLEDVFVAMTSSNGGEEPVAGKSGVSESPGGAA